MPQLVWSASRRDSESRGRLHIRPVAAAVAGAATLLLPCGMTLATEAFAAASGSPWWGAATMAVFVAGTAPLFGALGLAARRITVALRGRYRLVPVAVLGLAGIWTVAGGLAVVGVPIDPHRVVDAVVRLPAAAFGRAPAGTAPPRADPVAVAAGRQTITITVGSGGYIPSRVAATAGLPTVLVLRSVQVGGCVRGFSLTSRGAQWTLPVDGVTRIDLGVLPRGTLRFVCAMGMYTGEIVVG